MLPATFGAEAFAASPDTGLHFSSSDSDFEIPLAAAPTGATACFSTAASVFDPSAFDGGDDPSFNPSDFSAPSGGFIAPPALGGDGFIGLPGLGGDGFVSLPGLGGGGFALPSFGAADSAPPDGIPDFGGFSPFGSIAVIDAPPAPPEVRRTPREPARRVEVIGQYEPIKGAPAVSAPVPPGFSIPLVPAPDNNSFEKAVLGQFDPPELLQRIGQQ
jgi:hypothetical protein